MKTENYHPVIHQIYGHGCYEYLLVIHPGKEVNEKVDS